MGTVIQTTLVNNPTDINVTLLESTTPVVVNVPWRDDSVLSVNGKTGDVLLDLEIADFKPDVKYNKWSPVFFDGRLWRAREAFVAGSKFNKNDWEAIDKSSSPVLKSYESGRPYQKDEIVVYNGAIYRAKAAIATSSVIFKPGEWDLLSGGNIGVFKPNTFYPGQSAISHNGMLLISKTDFTSQNNFDITDWSTVGASTVVDWQPSTYFFENQIVYYKNKLYSVLTNGYSKTIFDKNDYRKIGGEYIESINGDVTPEMTLTTSNIPESGDNLYNVQPSWTQTNEHAPDFIKNKPIISDIQPGKALVKSGSRLDVQLSDNPGNQLMYQPGRGLFVQGANLENYRTISQQEVVDNTKVDKVSGKGLSTNDYTTTEKQKLADIQAGAEVNVQADWNEVSNTSDAFIKNKPTIPKKVSELQNDIKFLSREKIQAGPNVNFHDAGDRLTISVNLDGTQVKYWTSTETVTGDIGQTKASLKINRLTSIGSASNLVVGDIVIFANGYNGKVLNNNIDGSEYSVTIISKPIATSWGTISGDITNQTDLRDKLNAKVSIDTTPGYVYATNNEKVKLSSDVAEANAIVKRNAQGQIVAVPSNAPNQVVVQSQLSDINTRIAGKVDAVVGKALSSNDFTDTLKEKLENIPTVGDGRITINQGGQLKGSFTVNQTGNTVINLDAGGSGTNAEAVFFQNPFTFDGRKTTFEFPSAVDLTKSYFIYVQGLLLVSGSDFDYTVDSGSRTITFKQPYSTGTSSMIINSLSGLSSAGIPDAPKDGKTYSRQNGHWVVGGGSAKFPIVQITQTSGKFSGETNDIDDWATGQACILLATNSPSNHTNTLQIGTSANVRFQIKKSNGELTFPTNSNFIRPGIPLLAIYTPNAWIIESNIVPRAEELEGVIPVNKGGTGRPVWANGGIVIGQNGSLGQLATPSIADSGKVLTVNSQGKWEAKTSPADDGVSSYEGPATSGGVDYELTTYTNPNTPPASKPGKTILAFLVEA